MATATPGQLTFRVPNVSRRVRVWRWLRRAPRRLLFVFLPRTVELRWDMAATGRGWDKAIKAARARKASEDELQMLDADWAFDYSASSEEYESIVTRRLQRRASKLLVDVPIRPAPYTSDDNWVHGGATGLWYLTTPAMRKLIVAIRDEEMARAAHRMRWINPMLGVVGALAALAGALAAVLALLAK